MSALRSVIEELLGIEVGYLSDAELCGEAAEIARALDLLGHRLSAVTAEVAGRGCHERDGFLSVTRWLAVTADIDDAAARRYVTLGRVLRDHPETGRRAAGGDLSGSRVRILARAARMHPDLYREHEAMLLDLAGGLELSGLKKAVDYWVNCADAVGAEYDADRQREASYLFASQTLGGMVKLDGLFDKETGEVILTALDAAMTPEARGEGASGELRPAPKRRAEVLSEICRQFLDCYPGRVGGHRPHVSVIVDLETLEGRPGRRCELAHTGTITPETARRILCDAEASRVIVDSDSVPLDMGRAVRTVTPAQFRALAIRDGGCTYKGCNRPPAWCDAHHVVPWHKGGTTDLANLRLYCRRHHVLIHRPQHHPPTPTPPSSVAPLSGRRPPTLPTHLRI